jgi:competence ComEA-like helix-hairpin-helix protein
MPYSRPQLKLLLVLALTLLAGFGVREWRAGFPDMSDRLERFDREQPAAPLIPAPARERRPPAAPSAAPPAAASIGPSPADRRADPAPPAAADPRPLDINRASLEELSRLPGVGQGLAGRILAERERRGRFESPDALRYVLGMGPKKLAAIRELVIVSE